MWYIPFARGYRPDQGNVPTIRVAVRDSTVSCIGRPAGAIAPGLKLDPSGICPGDSLFTGVAGRSGREAVKGVAGFGVSSDEHNYSGKGTKTG